MSLYTTGELAKKCNVSVRTIQYYDERGILVPTELTEGGRRLFSEKDVATLETICFLRSLDISIKDIAEILESDESKKVIELLLDEQDKNLQAEIKKKTEQLEEIKNIRDLYEKINSINSSRIFITGHSEYDPETLAKEYFRDVSQGKKIAVPENYFPNDNHENPPLVLWRAHANLLYSNWLNYFVYQTTPYDLDTMGDTQ